MAIYETTNLNLAKLLEIFGYDPVYNVDEYKKETLEKFCFDIPENSALLSLLQQETVLDFLEHEEYFKFRYLIWHPEEGLPVDFTKPAFADLARLLGRATAFSGVQHLDGARDVQRGGTTVRFLGLLIRPFFSQFFNMNASTPDEYRTTAATSGFNAKNNDRFGKSGLIFGGLIPLLLSCPVDFASVRFKGKLDPRTADQYYTAGNFGIPALSFNLHDVAQQISKTFYRDSIDPSQEAQEAREWFAKQTKLYNEGNITEAELEEERSELNKTIAEIKGFLRINLHDEAEYNEMHFPAGILLANGYFCTDSLQQSSLDQYKKLVVFREFLSAEGNATPQQKELLCEMFEGTTEAQKQMLRNPEQMREKYLADYAKYFQDIVSSHRKRVNKLMENNKIEEALVLAMQADYFSQFTTTQGVRNQLKQSLYFTVFHSETKHQEKIGPEELSSLLSFNLKNIIDSDLVKSEDKKDFQRILYHLYNHLYIREINKFFCTTDSSINPTFPPEILGADGKLDLSKFLQVEETQDLLKPYFDYLDEKSHFIKEKQKLSSLRTSVPLAVFMGCAVLTIVAAAAIVVPPIAPFATAATIACGLYAISSGVVAISSYTHIRLLASAKLQQIENLRTEGKEITLPTAFKKIIDQKVEKLYTTITKNYARTFLKPRESQPNTEIRVETKIIPQTLGRPEEDFISV